LHVLLANIEFAGINKINLAYSCKNKLCANINIIVAFRKKSGKY